MFEPTLSQAYTVLLEAVPFFEQSGADVNDIEDEAKHADTVLARDLQLFDQWLDQSSKAVAERDFDKLVEALVHLRLHAMHISSDFSNLADSIQQTFMEKNPAKPCP